MQWRLFEDGLLNGVIGCDVLSTHHFGTYSPCTTQLVARLLFRCSEYFLVDIPSLFANFISRLIESLRVLHRIAVTMVVLGWEIRVALLACCVLRRVQIGARVLLVLIRLKMRLLFAITDLNDFLGAWLCRAFRLITNGLLVSIGVSSHLFETIVSRLSRQAIRCWSMIYTFLMSTSLNGKQLFLVLLLTSYVFLILIGNCVVGWACHLGCTKRPI